MNTKFKALVAYELRGAKNIIITKKLRIQHPFLF